MEVLEPEGPTPRNVGFCFYWDVYGEPDLRRREQHYTTVQFLCVISNYVSWVQR